MSFNSVFLSRSQKSTVGAGQLSLLQAACVRVSEGAGWRRGGQGVAAVTVAPLGGVKPCVTAATQICT